VLLTTYPLISSYDSRAEGVPGQGAEEDNLGPRGRGTSRHFWAQCKNKFGNREYAWSWTYKTVWAM